MLRAWCSGLPVGSVHGCHFPGAPSLNGALCSAWLPGCVLVSLTPHRKTHLSPLRHRTSSGGTEHSYLRVHRTNITNHLPEGVLESSLVQAGSLESGRPSFLQRTLGAEAPAHAHLRRPEPCEGGTERLGVGGNPSSLQKAGTRENNPAAISPGSHRRGHVQFLLAAALIKTVTWKLQKGSRRENPSTLAIQMVHSTFSPCSEKGDFSDTATGETVDANEAQGTVWGTEPESESSRKRARGPLEGTMFSLPTFSSFCNAAIALPSVSSGTLRPPRRDPSV